MSRRRQKVDFKNWGKQDWNCIDKTPPGDSRAKRAINYHLAKNLKNGEKVVKVCLHTFGADLPSIWRISKFWFCYYDALFSKNNWIKRISNSKLYFLYIRWEWPEKSILDLELEKPWVILMSSDMSATLWTKDSTICWHILSLLSGASKLLNRS